MGRPNGSGTRSLQVLPSLETKKMSEHISISELREIWVNGKNNRSMVLQQLPLTLHYHPKSRLHFTNIWKTIFNGEYILKDRETTELGFDVKTQE